jgi:predicted small integral membrane protein
MAWPTTSTVIGQDFSWTAWFPEVSVFAGVIAPAYIHPRESFQATFPARRRYVGMTNLNASAGDWMVCRPAAEILALAALALASSRYERVGGDFLEYGIVAVEGPPEGSCLPDLPAGRLS